MITLLKIFGQTMAGFLTCLYLEAFGYPVSLKNWTILVLFLVVYLFGLLIDWDTSLKRNKA